MRIRLKQKEGGHQASEAEQFVFTQTVGGTNLSELAASFIPVSEPDESLKQNRNAVHEALLTRVKGRDPDAADGPEM